ncbi:MAG: GyrI-like domain-containing protein [Christensenellales bacterium]
MTPTGKDAGCVCGDLCKNVSFPQSTQYEYAENVEFEVYSSADVNDPNYQCEIWIAVKEKQA